MKRILFVDDDINVLNGLRRGLHSMRGEWQMEFADSAENAMDLLDRRRMDALVTDVRMQDKDGFELLKETRDAYPHTLRIVLSGQTGEDALARSLASTHLFLSKPCDAEIIKRRLSEILVRGDQIPDETVKSMIAQLGGIPSLSLMVSDAMKLLTAADPDLDRIAEIVSMDMGIASTVLHFANSGYFGPGTITSNPARAVRWLGLETVRDLITQNQAHSSFDVAGFDFFDILSLCSESISSATSAQAVALSCSSDSVVADDAFAVGLFRDVGQIIFARVLGQFYDSVIERALLRGEPLCKTEREMIGSTHAEAGAYLLGLWGMPDTVVNAVAHHHSRSISGGDEFSALSILRIADAIGHQNICKTKS